MKVKILLISLVLLSLSPLTASACPTQGHPDSLAYIRRDNNRCEGLLESIPSTSTFSLIGLFTSNINFTRNISRYPETLKIRVAGTGKTYPIIDIQSFSPRRYRLNELDTKSTNLGFTFDLNTTILKKAYIPLKNLRPLAYITRDSGFVYFPVILGQPSGKYVFMIKSPQRIALPTLEIRHNGKVVHSKPINIADYLLTFTWEYGNKPAGTYELFMKDDRGNRRTYRFEHNPKLL